jgi:hypothetical protein
MKSSLHGCCGRGASWEVTEAMENGPIHPLKNTSLGGVGMVTTDVGVGEKASIYIGAAVDGIGVAGEPSA